MSAAPYQQNTFIMQRNRLFTPAKVTHKHGLIPPLQHDQEVATLTLSRKITSTGGRNIYIYIKKITTYNVRISLVLHCIDYLASVLSSNTILTCTSSFMEKMCCHDGENGGDRVDKPLLVCSAWSYS